MYYGVIACKDGTFYVCSTGFEYSGDALLDAENLLSGKDYGVLGVIQVSTLHSQHPCPALIPRGEFLMIDPDK